MPEVGAPDALVPSLARVLRRRRETESVWTLDMVPEDGRATPFLPGQFSMLTAFGVGEAAVSLSGDPADPRRLVHTVRAVGAVTRALTALEVGAHVGVRGPFGAPWPLDAAEGRDVIVVAGGLGLAPLRGLLYRLVATRERYGRLQLFYGARAPEDLLYRRELDAWQRRGEIDVRVTVDHATADWAGHVGVVTTLVTHSVRDGANARAFVCGPELMMRVAVAALKDTGVGDAAIHVSLERNMKCAVAWCGRCQLGPVLLCRDGPVFRYDRIRRELAIRER
jgi:NAD(P)H-flavin reductase